MFLKLRPDDFLKEKYDFIMKLLKNITILSLIFSIIIFVLIIANFVYKTAYDPLDSPELEEVLKEARETEIDQARKDYIRGIDLIARRAFFTSIAFNRVGAVLLLISVLILLISLKIPSFLRRKVPDPENYNEIDDDNIVRIRYWAVMVSGILLVSIAFLLPIALSDNKKSRGAAVPKQVHDVESIKKNWPCFRGPFGNGIAYVEKAPVNFDIKNGRNIVWKIKMPYDGFNSPVIWSNKLFLTGADEKDLEVFCYDTDKGSLIWRKKAENISGSLGDWPEVSEDTGYAASTAAVDGSYVFAIFATGDLVCFDFNGEKVWGKNIGVPDNNYGHASSLIVFDGMLIVQYDQNDGAFLYVFNTETGKQIWKEKRIVDSSWASPIIVNTGEAFELILAAAPGLISYDPYNKKKLWELECVGGEIAPSPVYNNGIVYLANEYERLAAVNVKNAEIVWESEDDLPNVASPAVFENYVIIAASYGTVNCFNSQTGEKLWVHEFKTGFYSSPIYAAGNFYLIDMDGVVYVVKAGKVFELISSSRLGETCYTTPAFTGGRMYIRGNNNLYCIGEE